LYHDKITQKEGASIFKAKCPGTNYDQNSTLERKRIAYILDEHSIKDKLDLFFNKIGEFLKGNLKLRDVTSRNIFLTDATVKAVHGTLHDYVEKLKLTPSIQTQYTRVLFNNPSRTGIQIYIDYDIILCKETPSNVSWCTKIQPDTPVMAFPLGVISIRIPNGTHTPVWLSNLIQSGYLIPSNKFSKFLHATSKFNSPKCKVLPGWFSNPIIHRDGHPLKHWYLSLINDYWDSPINPFVHSLGAIKESSLKKDDPDDNVQDPNESSSEENVDYSSILVSANNVPAKERILDESLDIPLSESISEKKIALKKEENPLLLRDSNVYKKPNDGEMLRASEVKLLDTQPAISQLEKDNEPKGLLKFLTRKTGQPQVVPSNVTPIRVEPKTHFANERTFLQWLNISIFMAIGSFTFFRIVGNIPQAIGTGILVLSLLFIVYSLSVFHYRRNAIVSKYMDGHYDDKFGPTVMVIILFK